MFRVGLALMVLAWVAVYFGFTAPGHASIRYWLFVTAHGLNVGGFALAAVADAGAKRRFSSERLVYVLIVELFLMIVGPIAMSAASATLY